MLTQFLTQDDYIMSEKLSEKLSGKDKRTDEPLV